jgi:glycosyltransferase involved in cell wall biosynthesis
MAATISVVVPCRNEAAHIEMLLQGIGRQTRAADEVIIVDGDSTDGTRDRIAGYARTHPAPPIRLLPLAAVSIPAALNAGIREAQSEIILRLDAHCQPDAAYIARAMATLGEHEASIVGGTWDIAPGADTRAGRAIALAVGHPLGAGDAWYRLGVSGALREADTVPFGCFRRSLWEELGGFDEHLRVNEDYDFNYRARTSGHTVLLDPQIRSTYFARPGLHALAHQYFNYGWWKAQMLKRHPRSLRWRQAVPPLFVLAWAGLALATLVTRQAAALLLAALVTYGLVLAIGTLDLRKRTRAAWADLALVPLAFAVVHVTWGVGLLRGLAARGR